MNRKIKQIKSRKEETMSEYKATVNWKRETPDFNYDTFDRTHRIDFAGGIHCQASSAPEFQGKANLVNPEELLASALASCHMLTFLAVASKSRINVKSYTDQAVASLDKNAEGKMCVTKITLHPKVVFDTAEPISPEKISELHAKAHKHCFIANSIAAKVVIEPQGH
jgi:organic hydroperoxide reductase OsmC/OhrA